MAKNTIPGLLVDWNWLRRGGPNHASVFPGTAYVDVWGADIYCNPPEPVDDIVSDAKWNLYTNLTDSDGAHGPDAFADEAVAHSMVTGFAEIGCANDRSAHSGGDSARFVQGIYEFFSGRPNDVAYDIWFNINDATSGKNHKVFPDTWNPDASAEYVSLWTQPGYVNGDINNL
jgi:hypothetical protein